ncbi:MAG TPA: ATP-binding protein [Streptosporangiaceae bacterium]|nr:ATP-binding protein [Streptosporangiaceae bacterium]
MTTRAPASFLRGTGSAGSAEPAKLAMRPVQAPLLSVLPGTPESVRTARQMVRQVLSDGHPAEETLQLVVSELVTNAIVHSKSGAPGGTVTVALCPGPGGILVQVRDDGGPSEPQLTSAPADPANGAEQGYGLLLVDALADRWGSISSPDGRITWCRIGLQPSQNDA